MEFRILLSSLSRFRITTHGNLKRTILPIRYSVLPISRTVLYWFHDLIAKSSSLARQTTATTLDTPKNIQPPEALAGGKIDLSSDVWALGCTVSLILIPTDDT